MAVADKATNQKASRTPFHTRAKLTHLHPNPESLSIHSISFTIAYSTSSISFSCTPCSSAFPFPPRSVHPTHSSLTSSSLFTFTRFSSFSALFSVLLHLNFFLFHHLPPSSEVDKDRCISALHATLHTLLASMTAGEKATRAMRSCKFW